MKDTITFGAGVVLCTKLHPPNSYFKIRTPLSENVGVLGDRPFNEVIKLK